jgi:hypothetical protein
MADGSVRLIKNTISAGVFQALASARGDEIVGTASY